MQLVLENQSAKPLADIVMGQGDQKHAGNQGVSTPAGLPAGCPSPCLPGH